MQETITQKILKYYLEYEIYNVANSSKIEVNNKNSIIIKDILDVKNVNMHLSKLKTIKISEEVDKFIGNKINNKKEIIDLVVNQLMELNQEQSNKAQVSFKIKNLIHNSMEYKREDKIIDSFINKLCDIYTQEEFWLYAHNIIMYRKDAKRMPIFILKCNIKPDNIEVVEANINTETLNTIISVILKEEISEVVLQYAERISNYSKELNELIDAGNVEHILDLFYLKLYEHINISRESIKNIINVKSNYKMNEEYIISLDELAEEGIKNIKEDIETLNKIINYDGYVPNVLNKYLNGNDSKKDINDPKYTKMYKGNYKSVYGVNENQYKIVNAIKDNDLIAIEGPPGTGKTSLLKEIIANNVVERANLILKNWNEDLEKKNYYGTYYNINWYNGNKNIIKSIVVSSKNGEAIENIINGINNEIRYMFPISRKYIRTVKIKQEKVRKLYKYKGIVCLPLGKQDNMQDFKEFLYQRYIPFLERISSKKYLDKYIEKVKEKYEQKLKEVQISEKSIRILEQCVEREKYFYGVQINQEDSEEQKNTKIKLIQNKFVEDKEKKQIDLEKIEIEKNAVQNQKEENKKQIDDIKLEIKSKEEKIEISQKLIIEGKNTINDLNNKMQNFERESKNIITKLLHFKDYRRDKNINFIAEINKYETINETEDKKISQYINEKSQLEDRKNKIEKQYEELKEKYEELENNYKTLYNEIKAIKIIEKFNKWDGKKTYWNYSNNLEIYGKSYLNALNQELFELALKLNEAYILKHSSEIIENLKLFLSNETLFVCQKFYDSTEIYNAEKQERIKSLWNTLFLCFPVVTTTLDSFSKRCFHLIPEYIDLEMIDEAGQILTHNLVSAIYRTRKAIIVGDINQIEPICNNINKDFVKKQKEIGEKFKTIKIPNNSIQALASKNTDILSSNGNIILNDHYRCEKNIINFSNEYVYENKLNMHKKDEKDKPFLGNMIALDVRGKKEDDCYLNKLEIESCIETIKYIKAKKENEKPTIAVITPFKKQKDELEKRINNEGLGDIKVGTVHAFQGQERDYIIFSQVIDSLEPKSIVNFIGQKCNMLNVAVTRAKKQFIYLGNLELAMQANNYMSKLINYITKNGLVYSLYDIENTALVNNWDEGILKILEPVLELDNDNIGLYISQHSQKGIMKDAKQHYELLKYAIKNAKSEICIMAPWVRKNVIDDEFLNDIKKLKENDCTIKIVYGFKKVNTKVSSVEEFVTNLENNRALGFASKEEVIEIIEKMNQIIGKENFIYNGPTHAKVFIIDGKYMFIGSHNWLSNAGKTIEGERALEASIITTNKCSIDYSKEQFFNKRYA